VVNGRDTHTGTYADSVPENVDWRPSDGGVAIVNPVQCQGSADSDALDVLRGGTNLSCGFEQNHIGGSCFQGNPDWRDVENEEKGAAATSEGRWFHLRGFPWRTWVVTINPFWALGQTTFGPVAERR